MRRVLMLSPAEILAEATPEEMAEFIGSMSEDEARGLLTNWESFLARPDQPVLSCSPASGPENLGRKDMSS